MKLNVIGKVFRSQTAPLALSSTSGSQFTITLENPIIVPKNGDVIVTALASTTSVHISAWMSGHLASII